MTLNGIALPRTFSASAQKMWPPSSGRNGNRLMMPSESEMKREDDERGRGVELDRLARRLVAADDAAELLALLGVEDLRDVADRARGDGPHLAQRRGRRRGSGPAGCDARLLVVAEAEAVALGFLAS